MATTFESTAPIGRNATQIAAEGLIHLHPFRFTGTAAAYFGIWIVNMALTMLTLGIYSAWAKVRTKRYFHGHTLLEGSAFGYHALPVQILKGRLIVLAAFVAYMVIVGYLPWFDFVLYLVILPLVVPWIVVRALRFNRRITSYRHIRFDFDGPKREAFIVYLMLWFGSVLTLGLLYPYAAWRLRRYVVDHSLFGTSRFHFDGRPGAFYRPYGLVALFGMLLIPLAIVIVYQTDAPFLAELLAYPPEFVVLALLIAMTPAFLVAAATSMSGSRTMPGVRPASAPTASSSISPSARCCGSISPTCSRSSRVSGFCFPGPGCGLPATS